MNIPKGPDITLPKIKAPQFTKDLFGDLRDRHLLPLVALLAVAVVAVPFALSSPTPRLSPTTGTIALPAPGTAAGANRLLVVADAPGLRSYRRRLGHLRAKDPFTQHFAAPSSSQTASVTGSPTTSGSSSPSVSSGPVATAPSSSGGNDAGGVTDNGSTTKVEVETKYASYEIDVRIVQTGGGQGREAAGKKPSVRRHLPELTMLPSRKTPAVLFMGVSADGRKALMLVSSDVKSVFGDANCVVGSQVCQLLALRPGLPETFIYGAKGRAFRIELLKIGKVLRRHPVKAPLGGS